MRIYILYSGPLGEQFINNFVKKGLAEEIVAIFELKPETIEEEHPSEPDLWTRLWEDPEKYIPKSMPVEKCDLLMVLGIHSKLGDLILPIAERLGAKAVLYPIDDRGHAPEARKTVQDDLEDKGIHVEFPEPFCLLDRSTDEFIDRFSQRFGEPRFEIKLDEKNKLIKSIKVLRDTPCGSATCVAKKIQQHSYNDLKALGEKIFHEHQNQENENYCLAEMDPLYPLMQQAADILKEAIFEACGFTTLKEELLEIIRKKGSVNMAELKEIAVDQRELCEAVKTVERYVEELAIEGKITIMGEDNPLLKLA